MVEPRREQAAEEVLYAARGEEARSRPVKAGIQEAKPGSLMTARSCRQRTAWPACDGYSRTAGMDDINHWIPASAGMTPGVNLVLACLCKQARVQRL